MSQFIPIFLLKKAMKRICYKSGAGTILPDSMSSLIQFKATLEKCDEMLIQFVRDAFVDFGKRWKLGGCGVELLRNIFF